MKTIALLLSALVASSAFAATAYFTGQMELVTTVTGKPAIRCQYDYAGNKFYRLFPMGTNCPMSVEVE